MGDVVSLAPPVDSPEGLRRAANGDVVERLRHLLERAERGEVVGCIVAFVNADGSYGHNWSRTDDTGRMLAAVTLAQAAYTQHLMDDLSEETDCS